MRKAGSLAPTSARVSGSSIDTDLQRQRSKRTSRPGLLEPHQPCSPLPHHIPWTTLDVAVLARARSGWVGWHLALGRRDRVFDLMGECLEECLGVLHLGRVEGEPLSLVMN